ncbi:hypothetical protein R1flu_003076 [Riccia fluitans]|uniref:Leucine-rich repeat-containing N-terminal plant-type domain-containing protein n=1 Tax=Riccia fluitans TaxID=41844 RepID=A0ABD1Y813_9MARC
MDDRSFRSWRAAIAALILSVVITGCRAQQYCNAEDSRALLEFKAGFIPTGFFFDSWIAGTDCCQWTGVNCTSSGRVQGLSINNPRANGGPTPVAVRDESYQGVVGATLGDLSELRTLEVALILFNGPMPNTFDKLKKLEELSMRYNNFSGSLAPSIGAATSLKVLRIDGQTFFYVFPGLRPAPVPPSFCQLKNIQTLGLTSFLLSGRFPQCFCQFRQLTELQLNDNNFEGVIPTCIGSSLGNLQTLRLSSNKFVGPIPSTLARLTNLQSLDLNQNKLVGNIPPAIGNLRNLQALNLGNNSLSGAVPSAIGNLAGLFFLDLSYNSFSRIPPELGNLLQLDYLQLSNNKLQGRLPPAFGNVGSQGFGLFLDISNNKLSGSIPDTFGSGNISIFFASNNLFTGGFPLSLTLVGQVDLSNNLLSDLNPVGTLPPVPKSFFLQLYNNRLSGPVPSWLETLVATAPGLSAVDISVNKFTGPVPAAFLSGSIFNLNASYNMFTGPLPEVSTSALGFLDLSHNGISGPITSTFIGSLLNTVITLDLSFNQLSGPLPANSGDFQRLSYLDLSDNMLSGDVPASIENIQSLEYLDLSNNQFTGGIYISNSF